MRINSGLWFLVFVLAFMALILGVSISLSSWQSKLLPSIISGLVLILGGIQFWKEIRPKVGENELTARDSQAGEKGTDLKVVMGWLLGFPLAIFLLGFLLAIPLFVFCYVKLRGRSWIVSIATASTTTLLVYVIFELALKANLWNGIVFRSISG